MIWSDSLRYPTRWSRPAMPYIWCSTSAQPAPIPNSSRPPDRWSTVTAIFASTIGLPQVSPAPGGRLIPQEGRFARDADPVVPGLIRVQVQLDVGVLADIAGLLTSHRIYKECLAVPPDPDGDRVGPPVLARRHDPDDE